jgi:O-antigen/teichoic acid export membrane protein
MNVNIIDAGASVLLVWLLLPRMGLWGYVVAIYATETLNTTLSLCRMLRLSRMPVSLWRQVFGPLLCAIGATVLCRLAGLVFRIPIGGTVSLTAHIAFCAVLYLGLCLATGVWGKEQTEDLRRIFGK